MSDRKRVRVNVRRIANGGVKKIGEKRSVRGIDSRDKPWHYSPEVSPSTLFLLPSATASYSTHGYRVSNSHAHVLLRFLSRFTLRPRCGLEKNTRLYSISSMNETRPNNRTVTHISSFLRHKEPIFSDGVLSRRISSRSRNSKVHHDKLLFSISCRYFNLTSVKINK